MTSKKQLTPKSSTAQVEDFLAKIQKTPATTGGNLQGRLIFAMDATASRQPTWDQAAVLQRKMFTATRGLGALDLQLVYFRGHRECQASGWMQSSDKLAALMSKIQCLAGQTQIERVLRHAIGEVKTQPVQALVYVGDCMEENIDTLGDLAGQLKLLGLPLFIFQEGYDPIASRAFPQLAKLSGGAHCQFDSSSASELGRLLQAVAIYATGGRKALERLGNSTSVALLQQLN